MHQADRCGGGSSPSTKLLPIAVAAALLISFPAGARAAGSYRGPISDERTTTYWSYAARPGPVRTKPALAARQNDTLRMWTEVHSPQVYLVLSEVVDPHRTW